MMVHLKNKIVFPLMIALSTLLVSPDGSVALTIDESITMAIANNPQIARFRAGRDEAVANQGLARSNFYPKLDANYTYLQSEQLAFGATDELATLGLTASFNLFNGFADLNASTAAKHRKSASEFQLQGVTADIVLATRKAFINALRARHRVATAKEGVELLTLQQRDASLHLAQGMIARNDLLRIEVELSQAKQELLQAEGALRLADRRLERIIGKPLDGDEPAEIEIDTMETQAPVVADVSEENYQQQLAARSEIRYLEAQLAAAKADKRSNRSGYMPRVDLAMTHERYGDSISPSGRDAGYDDDTIMSVNASWNLFNGQATRKSVASARAREAGVLAQLRDTRAELTLQLQSALEALQVATGRQREAATGVTQAEENYRITSNRRKQQLATTVDLLDASFLLTRARNLETDARYDLLISEAVLNRVLEKHQ